MVGVVGMMSAFATLTQKYKLPKLNTWTLNMCAGLLDFLVTGIICLATEDLTFPSEVYKIMFVIVQVRHKFIII